MKQIRWSAVCSVLLLLGAVVLSTVALIAHLSAAYFSLAGVLAISGVGLAVLSHLEE